MQFEHLGARPRIHKDAVTERYGSALARHAHDRRLD